RIRIAAAARSSCPRLLPHEELPHLLRSSPCFLPLTPHPCRAAAHCLRRLVPQADDRLRPVMFVPHRTEAGRAEHEIPARSRRQPEPARGEHSKKVPARKEQAVPIDGPHSLYHTVGPSTDLVGGLACRA